MSEAGARGGARAAARSAAPGAPGGRLRGLRPGRRRDQPAPLLSRVRVASLAAALVGVDPEQLGRGQDVAAGSDLAADAARGARALVGAHQSVALLSGPGRAETQDPGRGRRGRRARSQLRAQAPAERRPPVVGRGHQGQRHGPRPHRTLRSGRPGGPAAHDHARRAGQRTGQPVSHLVGQRRPAADGRHPPAPESGLHARRCGVRRVSDPHARTSARSGCWNRWAW